MATINLTVFDVCLDVEPMRDVPRRCCRELEPDTKELFE